MFCMYFMIKKIILEGFNEHGEGNLRGKKLKYFKKTKHNKKNLKHEMYFGFFSTYTGREPTITCSIDLEWSQGLGSLKMKV